MRLMASIIRLPLCPSAYVCLVTSCCVPISPFLLSCNHCRMRRPHEMTLLVACENDDNKSGGGETEMYSPDSRWTRIQDEIIMARPTAIYATDHADVPVSVGTTQISLTLRSSFY
jgi:hypothetical protein